jgi:GNAT superfamily N-acetyltransferase
MNDSITRITGDPREVTTTVPVGEGTGPTPGQGPRTKTRVSIRVATSLDGEALRGMFARSSAETIHRRFHTPFPRVPDKEFFVAVADGEIVGHAMYAMLAGGEAEMAIVVEDGWQSKGVGKALLRELAADAGRRGVQTFVGSVLTDNRPMLGLIGATFAGSRRAFDDGAYLVHMPLQAPEPADPQQDLGRAA